MNSCPTLVEVEDGRVMRVKGDPSNDIWAGYTYIKGQTQPTLHNHPDLVTDKLGSYQVARRELMSSVEHRRSRYLNNRAENSHQPTRQRERAMNRFKSLRHAQRFLSALSGICAHFRPRRHLLSAAEWRTEMVDRFVVWREVTAPDTAA
jgi:putative transposase